MITTVRYSAAALSASLILAGSFIACMASESSLPAHWLFYDSFDDTTVNVGGRYEDVSENGMTLSGTDPFAGTGCLEQRYAFGQVNAGWIVKVREYWPDHLFMRWYHKFEAGFEGYPPKMARMRNRVRSGSWNAPMEIHTWISDGRVVADVKAEHSTQANSVGWLPVAGTDFSFDDPSVEGQWVCFEMEVKLNTPGQTDGLYRIWADSELIVERLDVDLRGSRTYGINEVMLDCYWNKGSPRTQSRYYDEFVIATDRIGMMETAPVQNRRKNLPASPRSSGTRPRKTVDTQAPKLTVEQGIESFGPQGKRFRQHDN